MFPLTTTAAHIPLRLTPTEVGLPAKFQQWRPSQWECAYTTLTTDKKFIAAAIPTGGGKSPYCMSVALMSGGRWPYVTSSKGLQDQLVEDFKTIPGFCDMRGRQNYACTRGGMSCAEGRIVGCQDPLCRYTEARAQFMESNNPTTNYAYHLSSMIHSEGVGKMDGLILDEAHSAVQELSNAIEIKFHHRTYEAFYSSLDATPPQPKQTISQWRTWAKWLKPKASKMLQDAKRNDSRAKWLAVMDRFVGDLGRIEQVPESWIVDESNPSETVLAPLWPTEFAEKYLFAGAPKVILSSATIVPKTLSLLGVQESQSLFLNVEHTFPPSRCPIYVFPAGGDTRIEKYMPEGPWQSTMGVMDLFIRRRRDRKGIIVVPSYEWGRRIYKDTEHRDIMYVPSRASELAECMERFIASPGPAILMSPGITTGYDFKYSLCEYTIMLKVPFIPPSPIGDARKAADPEYNPYLIGQSMVQTFGRGMRAGNDQNEILILDAHAKWFFKRPYYKGGKNVGGFRHLIPPYVVQQLQFPDEQPIPPPTLAQQGIGLVV